MRSFWQSIALMLMAAAWLPQQFLAPAHLLGGALAGRGSLVETVAALQLPAPAAQFHQLRTPGLQSWVSKLLGTPSLEPCGQPPLRGLGVGATWPLAPAADELLKTWQFRQRTALLPRAPCWA